MTLYDTSKVINLDSIRPETISEAKLKEFLDLLSQYTGRDFTGGNSSDDPWKSANHFQNLED